MTRSLTWLVLLSMFFQLSYYKPEAGPLYLLGKIWPLLLAPLVVYGMVALRLPDRALYLAFTLYALAFTPFVSMVHLSNGFVDATAAAVKAWPVTFYFSTAAALMLLRPSEALLARCVIGLGLGSFGLMLLLWIVIPGEWYQPGAFGSNMFSWDEGRGSYIRMPLMLGQVAVFWLAHRFARERRLLDGVLLLGALLSMVMIYKARLPTGVTLLLILLILGLRLPVNWRWALGALLMLPVALATMTLGARVPALLAEIFDESLFIRLRSINTAWNWLAESPIRLIFGAGSISTFSDFTMADFFNAPDFWLTDIGWLGILLEYGVVGTGLVVLIYARALIAAHQVQRGDLFRAALVTYVLFETLCTAVYSPMYAPGPLVTVAALAWWFALRDRLGMGREAAGVTPTLRGAPEVPAWTRGRVPVPGRLPLKP